MMQNFNHVENPFFHVKHGNLYIFLKLINHIFGNQIRNMGIQNQQINFINKNLQPKRIFLSSIFANQAETFINKLSILSIG